MIILLKLLLFITLFQLNTVNVFSQGFDAKLEQPPGYGIPVIFQSTQPYAEGLVETILVNVISILFAVGGLGVVVYFIWGAVDWILSGGDKEKVSNARKKMTHAIIGLILLSLSYFIINLVGGIIGFNPLSNLQIKGLGDPNPAPVNN